MCAKTAGEYCGDDWEVRRPLPPDFDSFSSFKRRDSDNLVHSKEEIQIKRNCISTSRIVDLLRPKKLENPKK